MYLFIFFFFYNRNKTDTLKKKKKPFLAAKIMTSNDEQKLRLVLFIESTQHPTDCLVKLWHVWKGDLSLAELVKSVRGQLLKKLKANSNKLEIWLTKEHIDHLGQCAIYSRNQGDELFDLPSEDEGTLQDWINPSNDCLYISESEESYNESKTNETAIQAKKQRAKGVIYRLPSFAIEDFSQEMTGNYDNTTDEKTTNSNDISKYYFDHDLMIIEKKPETLKVGVNTKVPEITMTTITTTSTSATSTPTIATMTTTTTPTVSSTNVLIVPPRQKSNKKIHHHDSKNHIGRLPVPFLFHTKIGASFQNEENLKHGMTHQLIEKLQMIQVFYFKTLKKWYGNANVQQNLKGIFSAYGLVCVHIHFEHFRKCSKTFYKKKCFFF
ncbi:hypothetical protein RFI_14821 [Reticulomyxa filosa]|uniref:Uncharacterized protein n=1 Tax=Reticulomyxa filosa TaxID=46433 RepID=X6NAQ8_RETFI|nr:hypothetical protein RFI_14821 [Reticulomyxa filosa]|eukprot:ETO22377.1 hypothetical protein RFI_14821 [Reticulomyxa filosa]